MRPALLRALIDWVREAHKKHARRRNQKYFMRGYTYATDLLCADAEANFDHLHQEAFDWRGHPKYDPYSRGVGEALYNWTIYKNHSKPVQGE